MTSISVGELEIGCKPEINKILMKARHFLQVSSEIIGKRRHRSDVTRMTSSTDLQIAVTSTANGSNAPRQLLGHETKRLMSRAEHERQQFIQITDLVRGGMHQVVEY
jgi:hypothetical protein